MSKPRTYRVVTSQRVIRVFDINSESRDDLAGQVIAGNGLLRQEYTVSNSIEDPEIMDIVEITDLVDGGSLLTEYNDYREKLTYVPVRK
tara:strand:- start:283 stop:549 length:267 start_codon:yes stop_codon:yes gene_type:complete